MDATTAAAAGGGPAQPLSSWVAAAATSSGVKHVASRRLSACSVANRTPSDSACSSGTSAWKAPGRRSPARPLSTSCSLRHRSADVNVLMPVFQTGTDACDFLYVWGASHKGLARGPCVAIDIHVHVHVQLGMAEEDW